MSRYDAAYYRSLLNRALMPAVEGRQREIEEALVSLTGRVVQDGPFKGMRLAEDSSWHGGDIGPKLLGCYEAELHLALQRLAGRGHRLALNVGCAEGYYAVGLAWLLPQIRVHAFDIDPNAQRVTGATAQANDVSDRVVAHGRCAPADIQALVGDGRAALLIDCEGGEAELLDPEAAPALARCDIIVECHDFLRPGVTEQLTRRFSATHEIERLREGPRDPAGYPQLAKLSTLDRWLAVCENRPEVMYWLAMWSKDF
jgi:hypothetical protein